MLKSRMVFKEKGIHMKTYTEEEMGNVLLEQWDRQDMLLYEIDKLNSVITGLMYKEGCCVECGRDSHELHTRGCQLNRSLKRKVG